MIYRYSWVISLNFYKNSMNNMRIVIFLVLCAMVAVSSVDVFAQVDNQQFSIPGPSELSLIKMKGESGTTYVGTIIERSDREITILTDANTKIQILLVNKFINPRCYVNDFNTKRFGSINRLQTI